MIKRPPRNKYETAQKDWFTRLREYEQNAEAECEHSADETPKLEKLKRFVMRMDCNSGRDPQIKLCPVFRMHME